MTLIYIAGLGHSGSTYFSRILNQHPDLFAAGEIVNFYQELETDELSCACLMKSGRDSTRGLSCDFWAEIFERVRSSKFEPETISRVDTDRQREWYKALTGFSSDSEKERFRAGNEFLLNQLKELSGASHIVDSSKTPWRLLPLSRVFNNHELRIIHLIKSPRNQIQSNLSRGYGFFDAALKKYWRKNHLLRLLWDGEDNYRLLKFEDLVEAPGTTMQSLFEWLDLPPVNPFDNPPAEAHHLRGHIEAYTDHLEAESVPEPDPERLKQYDDNFNLFQSFLVRTLNHVVYS